MEGGTEKDVQLTDGNDFLKLLRAESSRLSSLVYSTEHELEKDKSIPEEVRGKMRVAVGKAKMLLKKKFSLFEELCLKNVGIQSDVRYLVTCEDLAGYWDTIVMQIQQVYSIFEEVDAFRKNNWKFFKGSKKPKEIERNISEGNAVIH